MSSKSPFTWKSKRISHMSSFNLSPVNLRILSSFENTLSTEQLDSCARIIRRIARPFHGYFSFLGFHHFQIRRACSPASSFQSKSISVGILLHLILLCVLVWCWRVDGILSKSLWPFVYLTSADVSFFNVLMNLSSKWRKLKVVSLSAKWCNTVTISASNYLARKIGLKIWAASAIALIM